ncbi:hypothetical protein [Flavobacterium laiguense]|uniref:Neuromedin U n=1 Tax=Flavobacterium laiguense TaxID=2169409 RepID=A0A2U1K2K8_9FLAO|nr:hypothetical protein [Flavobacterium laiguense]PWA11642.1 hypothetical protein DB891_02220 [Flavobacterium laiguense]
MKRKTKITALLLALSLASIAQDKPKPASGDAAELAKKLSNPIASLISMPFQNNTDVGIGAYNGSRNTLNFQPVIPISLSPSLNIITRVVLPIITQQDITAPGVKQTGLSDAVVSAFFSPAEAKNGMTWGVGPAILVPTASDKVLGTEKLGVGPTAVILKQANGWTYGALVNQIWSVAGSTSRADVNQMFVQPFFAYNWKSGAGAGGNFEITQNWEGNATAVYFNPTITGITKLGTQMVQLAVGPRIPVSIPDGSRPDFGIRAVLNFVFPK